VQPRTTAILLAVALALGAFVYFYEIRGAETRKAAEEHAKQLFPEVEAAEVSTIWLETLSGPKARLERREGDWQIVEPIEFIADGTVVEGLASSLADVASAGVIEEPQAPEVYGLGEAATVVDFLAGEQEYQLRIGRVTPVGGNTYASVEADPSVVYTVPTFRVNGFSKSLPDLRERLLLDFDPSSIRRIEAGWPPDGRAVLELSEEDDEWHLVQPLEARADQETVQSLLSDLRFMRASDFLDEPDSAAEAALETSEFEVRLLGEAGEGAEPAVFELTVGAASGEGRVVRSSQAEILFTVPRERLQDLPRRLAEYRYKDLAEFAILDAQKLELAFASESEDSQEATVIVAVRGEEGWTSTPEPMQPGKVARAVSELSRLEASDILAEAMNAEGLAALGLSPPTTVVRVFGAADDGSEPVLAELFLGSSDPERGIFALVPGRDTVYALDTGLAEHVPISLEAFRNRFVSDEAESDPAPEVDLDSGS
jgi:hypothetical protein